MKKVTICHKDRVEIEISSRALEAHLAHGDSEGVCDDEEYDGGFSHDGGNYVDSGDAGDPDRDSGINDDDDVDAGFSFIERGDAGQFFSLADSGQMTLVDSGPNNAAVPASCHCGSTGVADATLFFAFSLFSLIMYRTSCHYLKKENNSNT